MSPGTVGPRSGARQKIAGSPSWPRPWRFVRPGTLASGAILSLMRRKQCVLLRRLDVASILRVGARSASGIEGLLCELLVRLQECAGEGVMGREWGWLAGPSRGAVPEEREPPGGIM